MVFDEKIHGEKVCLFVIGFHLSPCVDISCLCHDISCLCHDQFDLGNDSNVLPTLRMTVLSRFASGLKAVFDLCKMRVPLLNKLSYTSQMLKRV